MITRRYEWRHAVAGDEAVARVILNDPSVMEASGRSWPLDEAAHHSWWAAAMASDSTKISLLFTAGFITGLGRLDTPATRGGGVAVSIAILGSWQHMGWGKVLLQNLMNQAREAYPSECLKARIRAGNWRSIRLFAQHGFTPTRGFYAETDQLWWVRP